MKLYQVEWSVPLQSYMMLQSTASTRNKKAFTTREKADEFYKQIWSAACLLQINGALQINTTEVEVE